MMNGVKVILCVLALGFTQPASPRDADDAKSANDGRISELRKKVKDLRAKKDVNGLQQLGAEIKAEWLAKKSAAYYPAILDVCLAMNSTRTTEAGINESIRDLAVAAIDSPGEKPAHIVAKLLLFTHGDYDYSTGQLAGAKWIAARRIRAERWLKVCKSIREQNAALPKPTGEVYSYVTPPEGLPNGVGPEAVKDPVLRKKFEEAIELNHQRHLAHRKKRAIEDLEKDSADDAARYLVAAFAKPPFRTDELAELLTKHNFAKGSAAMLKEVRRREAADEERAAKNAKIIAGLGKELTDKKLQYSSDGSTFHDVTVPFYVVQGTSITFKSRFADDSTVWQGSSGATGKGTASKVKFSTLSTDEFDFKTVTATSALNLASAHVIVFKLVPIYTPQDDFPGRDYDAYGVFEWINLSYKTVPAGIREAELGGLQWVTKSGSGDLYGGAGGLGTYQCSDAGSFVLDLQLVGRQFLGPKTRKQKE